jgi:hypothetical protein
MKALAPYRHPRTATLGPEQQRQMQLRERAEWLQEVAEMTGFPIRTADDARTLVKRALFGGDELPDVLVDAARRFEEVRREVEGPEKEKGRDGKERGPEDDHGQQEL